MIVTLKVERYLISSEDIEMALEMSYTCEGPEKAALALEQALNADIALTIDLPPELGLWRDMDDEEARDYIERRKAEDEPLSGEDDDEQE